MILSAGNWGANRNYLLLRLRPGNPTRALKHFRQVWEKTNPGFPCEYEFLDEAFDRMYTNEQRLSRILFSFAFLAVIISCLGLLGLSSYTAEEKTKEIGIRKVLGASSPTPLPGPQHTLSCSDGFRTMPTGHRSEYGYLYWREAWACSSPFFQSGTRLSGPPRRIPSTACGTNKKIAYHHLHFLGFGRA
jgi:hypothetical protein